MKKPKVFAIYAEFGSAETARAMITELLWLKFNRLCDLILDCGTDPNPKVVKILVPTLEPKHIHALADKLSARRITFEFQEIFPASFVPPTKNAVFFMT